MLRSRFVSKLIRYLCSGYEAQTVNYQWKEFIICFSPDFISGQDLLDSKEKYFFVVYVYKLSTIKKYYYSCVKQHLIKIESDTEILFYLGTEIQRGQKVYEKKTPKCE